MADFLTGNELNSALSDIFESSENKLIIVSPYIKLHERYKSILKTKIDNPYLSIIVVFGKNENDVSKSLNKEDFEFFKQFPAIEIRHEKRLHAKLYANELNILISSMNLYDYSQDTNIETGVISESSGRLGRNAIDYFYRVIGQAEIIFKKVPSFEKKMLGLSEKYVKSEVEVDNSLEFYSNKKYKKNYTKTTKKTTSNVKNNRLGYCIRTGKEIPFNIEMPFSSKAYTSWNKYKDENYPEKFCHFSGEHSEGKTSFKNPILRKNWKEAKKEFKL